MEGFGKGRRGCVQVSTRVLRMVQKCFISHKGSRRYHTRARQAMPQGQLGILIKDPTDPACFPLSDGWDSSISAGMCSPRTPAFPIQLRTHGELSSDCSRPTPATSRLSRPLLLIKEIVSTGTDTLPYFI